MQRIFSYYFHRLIYFIFGEPGYDDHFEFIQKCQNYPPDVRSMKIAKTIGFYWSVVLMAFYTILAQLVFGVKDFYNPIQWVPSFFYGVYDSFLKPGFNTWFFIFQIFVGAWIVVAATSFSNYVIAVRGRIRRDLSTENGATQWGSIFDLIDPNDPSENMLPDGYDIFAGFSERDIATSQRDLARAATLKRRRDAAQQRIREIEQEKALPLEHRPWLTAPALPAANAAQDGLSIPAWMISEKDEKDSLHAKDDSL